MENLQAQAQGIPGSIERTEELGKKERVKIWWSLLKHLYLESSWMAYDVGKFFKRKVWEKYEDWLIKQGDKSKAFEVWKEYIQKLEDQVQIKDIDAEDIHELLLPGIYPVVYFHIPSWEEKKKGYKNIIVIVRHWKTEWFREPQHFRIHIPKELENPHYWNFISVWSGFWPKVAFLVVFPDGYDFRVLFAPIERNIKPYLERGNEYLLAPYVRGVVYTVLDDAEHLASHIWSDLRKENEE